MPAQIEEGGHQSLLSVNNLQTAFSTPAGAFQAVAGISFDVGAGQTVGVVGESGCGKSVTALSIMRLVESPGQIVGGEILFEGNDLLKLDERQMRGLRGNRISMVFQDPMTSLNPLFSVGNQISEVIRVHQRLGRRAAWEKSVVMLQRVGIPTPAERARAYPHELSGGMRQRVMIAIALACGPSLLIADEPTTALDVTIQAQILDLLKTLCRERRMGVLLITHDLGVVAENCEQVVVMYAGRIVERAGVARLFASPLHPYTAGLLRSLPSLGEPNGHPRRLKSIPGSVPSLLNLPGGCRFRDRCDRAIAICAEVDPALEQKSPNQWAACHNPIDTA